MDRAIVENEDDWPLRPWAFSPRARGETEIAGDFTAVAEVAKEHLIDQHRRACQADAAQAYQLRCLALVERRLLLGLDFGNQGDDLV